MVVVVMGEVGTLGRRRVLVTAVLVVAVLVECGKIVLEKPSAEITDRDKSSKDSRNAREV